MTEGAVEKGAGFSLQAAGSGLLAAIVGFASSFAVVVQGLIGIGATQAEAASGLMALSLAMGLCGIYLSLKTRLPVSVAWSTPGAALLATTGAVEGGFAAAVGAFLVCALLRSEEHTSELQSLMRISYAVFCLKQKKQKKL